MAQPPEVPSGRRPAGEIPLSRRISAYILIAGGYFLYCYNWLITDYVRPYLINSLGLSLSDTASLSVVQNIGVTIGSLTAATIVGIAGRRRVVVGILVVTGALTWVNIYAGSLLSWMALRLAISLLLGGYYVAAVSFMVSMFPQIYRARMQALNSSMFSVAEIALGGLGAILGDSGWLWLLWVGGLPPILFGIAIHFVAPDDRRFIGFGESPRPAAADDGAKISTGWAEMLSAPWRGTTLLCLLLAGLNFTGYQLFSSFVTLYLKTVRQFDAAHMGNLVALIGVGSFCGGFFWAWISDRFGRRHNRWGFVGVAVFIVSFLLAPADPALLSVLGLAYGFCLSCTYAWGVYFTELFPSHLRPYGAALFHGGHILSLVAPALVAALSARWGLTFAMSLAPAVFLLGAYIWSRLPETLNR